MDFRTPLTKLYPLHPDSKYDRCRKCNTKDITPRERFLNLSYSFSPGRGHTPSVVCMEISRRHHSKAAVFVRCSRLWLWRKEAKKKISNRVLSCIRCTVCNPAINKHRGESVPALSRENWNRVQADFLSWARIKTHIFSIEKHILISIPENLFSLLCTRSFSTHDFITFFCHCTLGRKYGLMWRQHTRTRCSRA